jgi:hypothetical protein
MDDALDIAMGYLQASDQAVDYQDAQRTAANVIAVASRTGVRNRLLCRTLPSER